MVLYLVDFHMVLVPLVYSLAAASYILAFSRQEDFAATLATRSLVTGLCLHFVFFVLRFAQTQRYPIANFPEVLSAIAFTINAVYWYLEKVQKNRATGAFLVSLAAFIQLLASAFLAHTPIDKPSLLTQTSLWVLHTSFAVLGYTAFLVSAVYGTMFLLLYRALKTKKFGIVFDRMPPLDTLAAMGLGATVVGVGGLSVVIALGVTMSVNLVPDFYLDPKFIATVLVWVIYSSAALGYYWRGWRGLRPVVWTLVGFAVAVISIVLAANPSRSFHSFSA